MEDWPLIRCIRTGEEVRDEEFVYPLADGSMLLLRCDASPIYDDGGHIVAGVGLFYDITEQKPAEEQLARNTYLEENAHDAFIATDERLVVTAWNRGAEQMYGLTADEALGRDAREVVSLVMSDEQLAEALREIAEKGQLRVEQVQHRKDGTPVHIDSLTIAMRDERDEATGYLAINRDITERKRAEEEIEAKTHQQAVVAELGLRALAGSDLQSLMDAAVVLVARTLELEYSEVVEILPNGEELLIVAGEGWDAGIVGNTTVSAGFGSQAGYALISEEPVIVEDLRTETRFNSPPLLEDHGVVSSMSVVIHGQDEPFGVICADTTARRSFTQDDVNFMQAVANVLATAIERKEAREKLEGVREIERSRIARDLHDELLRDLADTRIEAQQIQRISEDSQQTLRLVRLIAALDRIGSQLRGAIYDLRLEGEQDKLFVELLESLVELHRGMARDSDIRLEVRDGVLSGPLEERGRELLRIVGEALTNARRHSGALNVRVGVWASEEKLLAEVSDDGQGFDAAEGSEQAAAATSGLGIRGMRERARALGGDLKIESNPETGTSVRFEVPLMPEGEESEVEVRILLVEDHAAVREAIASSFEREEGFEVVGQAGSLAAARDMIGAEPVDVAVIDLGLPDGYGGVLIRDLREGNPHAQALVLSASLDRAEIARAVEAGAAGVLHKTIHLDEVVEAVRRIRAGQTLVPLEEVVELLRFASSRREEEYEARQAIAQLTPREEQVLRALAKGLDSKGIAERLNISLRTERNHMSSILAKLGVHSQLQALVFALRHGLVEIP